jgi:hypothetical protein
MILATVFAQDQVELRKKLEQAVDEFQPQLLELVLEFVTSGVSPTSLWEFEKALSELLRELGRKAVEMAINRIEPESPEALPKRVWHERNEFSRKNAKTWQRGGVGSLFGVVELLRYSYEPLAEEREAGLKSFAPLLERLGIVANNATPALAEVVARDAAGHSEEQTLLFLKERHGVGWSTTTLRAVRDAVAAGVGEHLLSAQVEQVLDWLKEAASQGKIVLSVGRDGIFLPIRGERDDRWKEGAVATVSVLVKIGKRKTKRLGTVYLGQMPSPLQVPLSRDLTWLLNRVLTKWDSRTWDLVYVTDAGHHPVEYYHNVLEPMEDPQRPGQRLAWRQIVDFYHASQRLWGLGSVLFSQDDATAATWSRRMCHILKHEPNAVHKILHSAAALRPGSLRGKALELYQKAYNYLVNHRHGMDYHSYRKRGLPIGSGITEAACKTVFTQRFKCSGMTWKKTADNDAPPTGGQAVLILRLAVLSGVWDQVFQSYLETRTTYSQTATKPAIPAHSTQQAA